jgi:hypothetical protein
MDRCIKKLVRLIFPIISAHKYANPIQLRQSYFAGCLALRVASPAGGCGGARQVIGIFGL